MADTNGNGAGSMVARRQLGRTLTALRKAIPGLTQAEAATRMEWKPSKLSRLESGKSNVIVTSRDIRALGELYGAGQALTAKLLATFEQTKVNGSWASRYGAEIPEWFQLFAEMELAASVIRSYETQLVPGLLQTREYASVVVRTDADDTPDTTEEVIAERVEIRLRRAALLYRETPPAPTITFVIDESVIHRPVGGPATMTAQLRHLAEASEPDHVTVRILPISAGAHRGTLAAGSFVIMDFPADSEPTTVYSEGLTGAAYLDSENEVARHIWAWDGLLQASLSEAKSRDLLLSASKEYER